MWVSDVYHLLSVYHAYIEVTIRLQASHCSLPYFFKHLSISSLIFISKDRLFANVTVVTISLYPEVGFIGFLWNPGNHVPHHIVPENRTLQSEFSVFPNVQISYSSFMHILSQMFVVTRCKGVWEQNAGSFQVKLHMLEIQVLGGVEW
jgi:hypothetical protein